jgi:hypothetical protein
MTADAWHRMLQITGAVLGVPAAAAGTFAAYQSYFSTDVTCQKLRNDMIGIMERNVAPETKRSLLKKEVTEFDKLCGEADPEARAIFQAAVAERPAEAAHTPASAGASPQRAPWDALIVFGTAGAKEHYGWVAISRRHSGAWVPNFTGYAISDTSLPPPGTILSAKTMLPVWSEPQSGANDPSKMHSRLPSGACVRVLATRGGSGRLWAEVAPASCS